MLPRYSTVVAFTTARVLSFIRLFRPVVSYAAEPVFSLHYRVEQSTRKRQLFTHGENRSSSDTRMTLAPASLASVDHQAADEHQSTSPKVWVLEGGEPVLKQGSE